MFTISVGNLPPGATVLIKVTFVSELIVRDGSILFSLPGSVAPWQESAALNQTTQVRKAWTGDKKKSHLKVLFFYSAGCHQTEKSTLLHSLHVFAH